MYLPVGCAGTFSGTAARFGLPCEVSSDGRYESRGDVVICQAGSEPPPGVPVIWVVEAGQPFPIRGPILKLPFDVGELRTLIDSCVATTAARGRPE